MVSRYIPIALLLFQNLMYADVKRSEPSLFLEYERETSRISDNDSDEVNPFKKILAPINAPKAQTPAPIKTVSLPIQPAPKPVEIQKPVIGNDALPFLVITKPVDTPIIANPSCAVNRDVVAVANNDIKPKKSLFQNLKTAKEKVMTKAKEFLGTSYGFGNKDAMQTDCSGFTQQVFSQFGIALPHSAAEQAQYGVEVDAKDLQIGDLLFYHTYKDEPSHVAIYAGDNQIIHASYKNKRVQYDSIDKGYYKQRFMYAKRIALNQNDTSNE